MFNYEEESFAVLFGSVARGDFNKNSDIDIFLYNYPEDKAKKKIALMNLPQLPINFVSYDSNMLCKFHEEGSLFLYHIYKQGELIDGDNVHWNELCHSFVLKKSFQDEIKKIRKEIMPYRRLVFLNGYYLSALVNIYPLLKNYCIFTLANQGIYEFNKEKCIILNVADDKKSEQLLRLQQFYDYSVRGLDVPLNISPNSGTARELIECSYNFIRNVNDYQ